MGTRCNVVINYGKTKLYLYRHWDGYYAETGDHLRNILFHSFSDGGYTKAAKFINNLLAAKRDVNKWDSPDKPQYEVTSQEHGDIEYKYTFTFMESFEQPVIVRMVCERAEYVKNLHGSYDGTKWVCDFDMWLKKSDIFPNTKFIDDDITAMRERARKIAI